MRVENNPINTNVGSVQTPQVANPVPLSTDTPGASAETTAFTPTSDLTRLLSQVRQIPDACTEVIDKIAAQVAAGGYNPPSAALDAARNMLDLMANE
jgi:hypothetical protein